MLRLFFGAKQQLTSRSNNTSKAEADEAEEEDSFASSVLLLLAEPFRAPYISRECTINNVQGEAQEEEAEEKTRSHKLRKQVM